MLHLVENVAIIYYYLIILLLQLNRSGIVLCLQQYQADLIENVGLLEMAHGISDGRYGFSVITRRLHWMIYKFANLVTSFVLLKFHLTFRYVFSFLAIILLIQISITLPMAIMYSQPILNDLPVCNYI